MAVGPARVLSVSSGGPLSSVGRGRYVTCSILAQSHCLRAAKTRRSHVATFLHDEKKMRSLAARILLLLCLALALLGSHAAEPEAASPSASQPEHTQEEMDEAREEFESIDTNKVCQAEKFKESKLSCHPDARARYLPTAPLKCRHPKSTLPPNMFSPCL